MTKTMSVYILTNRHRTVLYTGVTANLARRLQEHRSSNMGFTFRYSVRFLVYHEQYQNPMEAIRRETAIKAMPRKEKNELIESVNPIWEFWEV